MNRTIFIVDDDPRVLAAYKSIFDVEDDFLDFFEGDKSEIDKIDAVYFPNGETMLVAFEEAMHLGKRIPLCIVDMLLPGKSGLDVGTLLRQIDPDVQLLLITAYSDVSGREIRRRLQKRFLFQRKPFHADELLSQIEVMLQLWNHGQTLEEQKLKLQESNQRFNLVVDGAALGFWDWDLFEDSLHYNRQWAEMLGREFDSDCSDISTWVELIHPDDKKQVMHELHRHIQGEANAFECEYRLLDTAGHWVWVMSRGRILHRDNHGRPQRMCGVQLDITESKNQREILRLQRLQLEQQNQLLEGLLRDLNDVIFETDFQGHVQHLWNENPQIISNSEIFFQPDELHRNFGPQQALQIQQALAHCAKEQCECNLDLEVQNEVKERWINLSLRPLADREHILVHIEELTARKRQEIELQESIKAKTLMMAMLSHEIRTPLNGVLGIANLLENTPLNQEQKDLVQILNNSSEVLLSLVNDILDFSKIEANQMSVEWLGMEGAELLHKVYSVVHHRAAEKGLDLRIQCQDDLPIFLGDPTRLRQILLNFVTNAIKFTDSGSVEILLYRVQNRLRFEVRDTGMGISPEQQSLLFKPYSQADQRIARLYGGTGLGLAICKNLVELMQGDIGVQSEAQAGSLFWFEIPLRLPQGNESHTRALPALREDNHFEHLRILVVEDNAINRKVLRMMLKRLGCQAKFVHDGREALKLFDKNVFDLILMDMQLPGMDGIQVTDQWRLKEEQAHRSRASIVALTANASAEDKQKCLASGMNAFISKPLHLEELQSVLAQSRCISQIL